ncbi:alpha/beta fold hydrolase [Phycicoccus avicenniae]|uniref:alpha/beta fold hydrolase n=1 Tax=Phycicoccus avicenniae TaxID=2828860 RepID=UPI002012F94F|nr:alpha/beta hydrolase [Phycicoccus avicenniae]
MTERRRVDGDRTVLSVLTLRCAAPTGPDVVLVHGTGSDATTWDEVAVGLGTDRTVHAVDLRGHGRSDRPGTYSVALMAQDLAQVLPHLVAGPVDLAGHSLGGLVALRLADDRPDLVRRLVLEDVGRLHPRPPTAPARPDEDPGFDWRVVEQVRPEVDDPAADWPDLLARLRPPVLVVAGGPERFVDESHVHELVDLVPDGRSLTLGTGHEVHLGAPAAFVTAVRTFLDG